MTTKSIITKLLDKIEIHLICSNAYILYIKNAIAIASYFTQAEFLMDFIKYFKYFKFKMKLIH